MLEFRDVSYSYRMANETWPALSHAHIQVEPGRFCALVGKNGSGKSTLVRLANGLQLPDSGQVLVDGLDTREDGLLREIRARVGIVNQDPETQIVASTVYEDVAFGPCNLGLPEEEVMRRTKEALKLCNLSSLELRAPHSLSGGERQRLALAGVMAMNPTYLALDEAGSMLDPHARGELRRLIGTLRTRGVGILLVTHDLADITECDTVFVLVDGQIIFTGTPREFLGNRALVERSGCAYTPLMHAALHASEKGVATGLTHDAYGLASALADAAKPQTGPQTGPQADAQAKPQAKAGE